MLLMPIHEGNGAPRFSPRLRCFAFTIIVYPVTFSSRGWGWGRGETKEQEGEMSYFLLVMNRDVG